MLFGRCGRPPGLNGGPLRSRLSAALQDRAPDIPNAEEETFPSIRRMPAAGPSPLFSCQKSLVSLTCQCDMLRNPGFFDLNNVAVRVPGRVPRASGLSSAATRHTHRRSHSASHGCGSIPYMNRYHRPSPFSHWIFPSVTPVLHLFFAAKIVSPVWLLARVYEPGEKNLHTLRGSILFPRPLQAVGLLSFGSTKRLYSDSEGMNHLKKSDGDDDFKYKKVTSSNEKNK